MTFVVIGDLRVKTHIKRESNSLDPDQARRFVRSDL